MTLVASIVSSETGKGSSKYVTTTIGMTSVTYQPAHHSTPTTTHPLTNSTRVPSTYSQSPLRL